jgi:hypothetical protein
MASINIPLTATPPTTPVAGDIWTNTAGTIRFYTGAATRTLAMLEQAQTFTQGQTFSGNTNSFGTSTGNATDGLSTGATLSGNTKTVNIGTNGVAGSTTNVTIGSTAGTSTTILNGAIRFGTYTATVLSPTGYITITDSGGTTRRLLVG